MFGEGSGGECDCLSLKVTGFRGAHVQPASRPIAAVQSALCVRPSSNMANICTAAALRRDVSGL